jgi:hypothetical protein
MLQALAILQPLDRAAQGPESLDGQQPISSQALIARLEELAAKHPELAVRLEQQMAAADKGRDGQPLRIQRAIQPQTIWTVALSAQGGETLHVLARASLPETVELLVEDRAGTEICRRRPSSASTLSCSFTPEGNTDYQVRLINRNLAAVTVVLYTN